MLAASVRHRVGLNLVWDPVGYICCLCFSVISYLKISYNVFWSHSPPTPTLSIHPNLCPFQNNHQDQLALPKYSCVGVLPLECGQPIRSIKLLEKKLSLSLSEANNCQQLQGISNSLRTTCVVLMHRFPFNMRICSGLGLLGSSTHHPNHRELVCEVSCCV